MKEEGRRILGSNASYELREPQAAYGGKSNLENSDLRSENTYFWKNIS